MTRAQLIDFVKVKLDEYSNYDDGLLITTADQDVMPVKSYIDKTLDEASEQVVMLLPNHLVAQTSIPNQPVHVDGYAKVELPADFLKLSAYKITAWEREVDGVITPQNPEYIKQKNKYTRGGYAKPAIVLTQSNNKKYLEIYPFTVGDTVEVNYYIKRTVAENYTGCESFIILMAASKVFTILERSDLSKAMMEELSLLIKSQAL